MNTPPPAVDIIENPIPERLVRDELLSKGAAAVRSGDGRVTASFLTQATDEAPKKLAAIGVPVSGTASVAACGEASC